MPNYCGTNGRRSVYSERLRMPRGVRVVLVFLLLGCSRRRRWSVRCGLQPALMGLMYSCRTTILRRLHLFYNYAARHGLSIDPTSVDSTDGWDAKMALILRAAGEGWGPRVVSFTFGLIDAATVAALHSLGS